MEPYEFKKEVEYKLLNLKYSRRIDRNQLALRCKFCGDSKKDPRKTRFYVLLNLNRDDAPILYNCFNCGECGILTPSVLRTFEINDLTLNSNLLTFNKVSLSKMMKSLKITDNKYKFKIPIPKNTKYNVVKKEYIENRLGILLSKNDIEFFKIIFSLEDFILLNKIKDVNCKKERAIRLNNDYVGFLTCRNEFIVYRDVTGKNKLRYDKYSIFNLLDNSRKFYVIPVSIDRMSTETININLAEGVFDILGVYFHINNKNSKNNIYVAVCDSSYTNVIKYFLGLGFIGENIVINIFSDSDHDLYFYNRLIDEISPWVKTINIYYNTLGKDFGVRKDQISVIKKNNKYRQY